MPIPRILITVAAAVFVILISGLAYSQEYPGKPVRMLTTEAGGTADFLARLLAQGLSANLGQQVIVENQGGGGGISGGLTVAKAQPDGHTLLFYGSSIWLLPFLRKDVPWDPLKDFSPITMTNRTPLVLVVHASVPVKSTRELISLAKARPGALDYASGSVGSIPHLAAELLKSMAGINIVQINYRGAGPSLNALIRGEVQVLFSNMGSVEPHVKSGRLRALAVTSAKPTALAPGLPAIADTGVPGYEVESAQALFAPARTPAPIIDRLNQETIRVLNRADVKEKLFSAGVEAVGSSPEQFAAKMRSDMSKWGKVIKDAGIHAD